MKNPENIEITRSMLEDELGLNADDKNALEMTAPKIDKKDSLSYSQWGIHGGGKYTPAMTTTAQLPSGFYEINADGVIGTYMELKKVNTDELYQLPSPELTDIIEDIEKFWDRADKYKEYGFLHKRGILLYGAPGAGKSGIIQLCTKHLIDKMDGIVINLTNGDQIELYSKFIGSLRTVEPNRPLIVILEDIDSIAGEGTWSTSMLLNLLDGGCQLPLGVFCETELNDLDKKVFKVWVSVADVWDTQVKHLYYETTNTEELPEKIVEHIHRINAKSIFISRDAHESNTLNRWLSNLGFAIESKSLIDLKKLTIKDLPKSDWLFFSSKHAVEFFFMQKPDIGNTKIGCIGKSTSQAIRELGLRADFIGQSTDTKLVGKQFSARVGLGKVVFPVARESMRTIQWQFPKQQNVIDLPIYAALKVPHEVPETTDILVFTSPSNAESYLEKNKIHPHQKVIAMGEATEKSLLKAKVKADQISKPHSFDDLGLYRAILHTL